MSSGDRFWFAERVRQGEVGGCTRRVQTARPRLGVAVNSPWLHGAKWAIMGVLSVNGPRKQCSHQVSRLYVHPLVIMGGL